MFTSARNKLREKMVGRKLSAITHLRQNIYTMKTFITLLFAISALTAAIAQTRVEKNIPWKSGQKLVMDFDYPDVKIHTWDKNEVSVTGTASITRGENDNAFELVVEEAAGQVTISSRLNDKENIPQRIVIKKGDQEFFFKARDYNDPEIQKFLEENGHEYSYMSNGIIRDVQLEIFVPKGTETTVLLKYGTVEITKFDGPLTVDAKYGKIDASIVPQSIGELTARARHGEILTNLDIKFDQESTMSRKDHWTVITARPGKGPAYRFETKYGNVYLRKPQ
jgi:hypothetical protein